MMTRLDSAAPFVVAMMLYVVSPLLSRQVMKAVSGQISGGRAYVQSFAEGVVPYYLTPESVSDYVEYALDAIQVFPGVLLPIIGAVFALTSGVPTAIALSFLIVTCIVALGVDAWILTQSAPDYVSRKWHGYSVMTLIGLSINAVGLGLTVTFGG
jgi:hypothetical protein